jgi:N-methylhydantoinase B
LPGHLGTFPGVMRVMIAAFGKRMRPGDVYLSNDPYTVGLHLPDIVVVRPIFAGDRHLGFALAVVHHVDIGGLAAGGMPTYATELYAEGLRIPPLRLFDRGRLNETLVEIIRKNVRVPEKVVGDLKGQAAACHVGQKRLVDLAEQHGLPVFEQAATQLLDYTEAMSRRTFAAWPDGTYRFEDVVDDDGMGTGPITIRTALTVADDRIALDFAGTDRQVRGSINCPIHSTFAGALTAVRCVLDAAIPTNSGLFRAVSVTAPPGTIVHPVEPAATCNRALVLSRVADVVFGALAQVVPDRVPACSESMTSPMTWSTRDPEGRPLVWVDNHISGRGGCPGMDAQEGIAPWVYNANNTSIEITEADFPLRFRRFGFVPDSEGAGKFRGGLATERVYEVLAEEAVLTFRSDRHSSRPWGLAGGRPGRNSSIRIERGGEPVPVPPKFTTTLRRADVVHSVMQSGGGWGDPFERNPEAVLEDVLNEKIDAAHAREVYGVILSPGGRSVDLAATRRARAGERP